MSADVGAPVGLPPPLVGRERDLALVTDLLDSDSTRLVTVSGRAGVGKTATVLEVGGRLAASGRWVTVVRLESARTLDDVLLAFATAVSLPSGDASSLLDRLAALSADREMWIVLDNCEHLGGSPHPVQILLETCPGFRFLATSIRPLRLPGEQLVTLEPLTLPGPGDHDDDVRASPAVQLFLQRAAEASVAFDPRRAELSEIAELCRRVDGLPLALELLAARAGTAPPAALDRFLRGGLVLGLEPPARTPLDTDRHRSLRAALAWTHRLLSPEAAALFRRMAVYAGPATLEMLAGIHDLDDLAPGPSGHRESALLDLIAELVDVRLIESQAVVGEPGFGLLPLIRDFAAEQLAACGEAELAAGRRTEVMVAMVATRRADLDLAADAVAMDELSACETDLRQVLSDLVAAGDVERGLELASGLAPLVFRRGYDGFVVGAMRHLLAACDRPDRPAGVSEAAVVEATLRCLQIQMLTERPADLEPVRAALGAAVARARDLADDRLQLLADAIMIRTLPVTHDFAGAAGAAAEGVELADRLGDDRVIARFSGWAGMVRHVAGDIDGALALARRSIDAATASGDPQGTIVVWMLLRGMPEDTAQPLLALLPPLEELLTMARSVRDQRFESLLLRVSAGSAIARGDAEGAAAHVAACLRVGDRTLQADALVTMAPALVLVAVARGDLVGGARLHGLVADTRELLDHAAPGRWKDAYEGAVAQIRIRLGEVEFQRITEQSGRAVGSERIAMAREYADRVVVAPAEPEREQGSGMSPPAELTPRECEVLVLLATGATNKQISQQLGMTPKTVMHHSVAIYRKLGVRGRAEATAWAFRAGVVN